jgi:hypothetical protein
MTRITRGLSAFVFAILMLLASRAWGDQDNRTAPGEVAYHYVGRVKLNFATGTATILGYITHLKGVPATTSLFSGSPSEATAFFTFRADTTFQALAGNGNLGGSFAVAPALITPGPIKMYFTPNPAHNWDSPDTFSSGQLIATFAREVEQQVLIGPIATNTASAPLTSSSKFDFGGQKLDLGQLIPRGVTNVTTANAMPLVGSTAVTVTFAFAGYALGFGD